MSWAYAPLADLCTVFTDGDWIESKDQSASGVRLIQTGNIGEGSFKLRAENARYISDKTFRHLNCTPIFPSDCLISRLPDPVGRACILPDIGERMITAVDCTIVRFRPTMSAEFFNYYAQSHGYARSVEKLTTGATRQRISRSNLGAVHVPVPPQAEQRRIVAFLDEALADIESTVIRTEAAVARAHEVLAYAKASIFARVKSEFSAEPLAAIAEFKNGLNFTRSSKGEVIKIVGVKDFQDHLAVQPRDLDDVTIEGTLRDDYVLRPGDILTVRSNGNRELIGRCIIAGELPRKTSHSGFTIRIRTKRPDVQPGFLVRYLKSSEIRRALVESGDGTHISSLNQGALAAVRVPVPSARAQAEIVAQVDAVEAEVRRLTDLYESRTDKLKSLKEAVLSKAFTPPADAIQVAAE